MAIATVLAAPGQALHGRRRPARARRTRGSGSPTAAEVMHSVQIGRSQFEHEMRVSRPGWR